MGLQTYRAKRDFDKTREPRGGKSGATQGHSYVIQKHAARRLHYDLRLELDGVLKSWAVTRGPSLVPGEKRLAVEVEDHPLQYGTFEGTIPQGQYGGGSVIVWDRGTWAPEGDPHKGMAKGHLDFSLDGEKLRGRWHLVRMAPRRGEKRRNWLLIKANDEEARREGARDILDEEPESVASGRSIDEVGEGDDVWDSSTGVMKRPNGKHNGKKATRGRTASNRAAPQRPTSKRAAPGRLPPTKAAPRSRATREKANATPAQKAQGAGYAAIKGAVEAAMPGFVAPCLATLSKKPPEGDRWVHEIKFDGYRLQAHLRAGKVVLYTRAGLDWTSKFGKSVTAAFANLAVERAIIDGELVVESEAGASDFSLLQEDLSEGRTDRFRFYAFDLIYADGYDLRKAALVDRKQALDALLADAAAPLMLSRHLEESGALVLQHACRLSLEGVVSKLANSPYRSGRGTDWIKSKCSDRQEFVIAGFVPSTAMPRAIGSLVLGYNVDGDFAYAGRVGTGFSQKTARLLYDRLAPLEVKKRPFAQKLASAEVRGVTWVRPELAAEVEFRGWTGARILRHAAFRGLREDKPAAQISLEQPVAADPPAASVKTRSLATTVVLTHPDRVYWPDVGLTKQGLADYYADVWKWMAPHVVARPLALLRCPDGMAEQCFFQKQPWKGLHKSIAVLPNSGPGGDNFLAIDSLDGLIAMVQAAVLEIHPWGATVGDVEHPDRLIFDLDPGPHLEWTALIAAAREVRERLEQTGLKSFVKTSGGKGLHVVAPLRPEADWDTAKAFAKGIAESMANDNPRRYTAVMSKSEREQRIFVDYLRNGRGATAAAPFSTRARAGAPVSAPLAWDELNAKLRGDSFNVGNIRERLGRLKADPWASFFTISQVLPTTATTTKRTARRRAR